MARKSTVIGMDALGAKLPGEYKQELVDKVHEGEFDFFFRSNNAARWLVMYLASHKIPFKAIHSGYGIKRVTSASDTCPRCNGTGIV